MAVTFDSVFQQLKKSQYSPIYFLQGEETYFIDRISDYIEENALEESQKGFNQIIIYGKDADVSVVVNNARRFPMMSERQVVIVKEAQELKDLNSEKGSALLINYLQNPQPSTILVFCHKYKTIDKRKKLGKIVDSSSVNLMTKKMYDNQVPDFVRSYFNEKGFEATPKAIQMIADSIGNNLTRITNEVDKLLTNFAEKVKVEDFHVSKYIGISKEYNVFELQKALSSRQVLKANQIINYFAANPKSNPTILVIFNLFSYFNKLLLVHGVLLKNRSAGNNEIASTIGVNPYFVKEYMMAVQNYPLGKVINNIAYIRDADMKLKGLGASGSQSEGSMMKELIFKILH